MGFRNNGQRANHQTHLLTVQFLLCNSVNFVPTSGDTKDEVFSVPGVASGIG